MNAIDIAILVVIGLFATKGLIRGLVIEVFTLAGLLVGYIAALREMGTLSGFLGKHVQLPELVLNIVAFLIIFLAIVLIFRWVAGALRRIMKWTFIGWLDRGGGAMFGILKGLLIASLLLLVFSAIPFSDEMEDRQEASLLYDPVRSVAPAVFNLVKHAFPQTQDFYEEIRQGFSETSEEIMDRMQQKGLEKLQKEVEERVRDR